MINPLSSPSERDPQALDSATSCSSRRLYLYFGLREAQPLKTQRQLRTNADPQRGSLHFAAAAIQVFQAFESISRHSRRRLLCLLLFLLPEALPDRFARSPRPVASILGHFPGTFADLARHVRTLRSIDSPTALKTSDTLLPALRLIV